MTDEVEVYDITTRQWNVTALASLTTARNELAGAAARDVVVFAGGACVTPQFKRYDPLFTILQSHDQCGGYL